MKRGHDRRREATHRGPTQRGGPHRGPTTGGEGHTGDAHGTHTDNEYVLFAHAPVLGTVSTIHAMIGAPRVMRGAQGTGWPSKETDSRDRTVAEG